MIYKTYRTYALKGLSIPFTIDGVDVYVTFKRGCTIGSTATYTTANPKIQAALEDLRAFNVTYYLEKVVSVGEEEPVVANAPEVVPVPVVEEEENEVVDILDAQTFKNLVELRNALKEKGIDVSQVTNVKAGEAIAKKNGYNYTVEKKA